MATGVSSWRECAFYCYKAATSIHALITVSQNKTAVERYIINAPIDSS